MENLLDALFPPKCLFCRENIGAVFCLECLKKCTMLENNIYFVYLKSTSMRLRDANPPMKDLNNKLEVFSPFDYDGDVRQCIKYSKYGARQFSALKTLSVLGINYTFNLNKKYEDFVAVPIPLNKRKFRSRGFNQAEVIAKVLADKFKLPLSDKILLRTKETETQFKFNREQRYENMENAFGICNENAKGKKILLVDDICTSGATLAEASSVLYKGGAEEVRAFTLSRRL